MRRLPSLAVAFSLASFAACGPSARDDIDGGPGGGGDDGGGSGSNVGGDGCSDAARLVYVVDEDMTFSKFDPSTKTFTDIGTLDCPDFFGMPFSMGVDRNATAWVEYDDGSLFQVDTTTLDCTATNWSNDNLVEFGMGFSTDTVGGTTDQLYIAGGQDPSDATATFATLSTTAFTAHTIGTVTGWPELSGTSNAELWGFFPATSSTTVVKLDKTTGHAVTTYTAAGLSGQPEAWAFAAWGGDFWMFLEKDSESSTTVYQMAGSASASGMPAGTILGHTATGSRQIVGAGVSTCAPVVIGEAH